MLAVEVDGPIHATRGERDRRRDAWLGARGIAVLRVTNEQVLARPEEVVRRVRRLLSERLPGPLSRRARRERGD